MFNLNATTAVDSYKVGHIFQYPKGTEMIYSNLTPRSSKHARVLPSVYDNKVVVVGIRAVLQAYLVDLWNNTFFKQDKEKAVSAYKRRVSNLLGKDFPVKHFEDLWELGYLPLEIRALPEGTLCPVKVPLLTIHNTKPEFYWLTNYVETALSAMLWPFITASTNAYYFRKLLEKYQQETGSADFMVPFQGHDFSLRGLMGLEAGAMIGFAHLVNFNGSDNLLGIDFAERYYDADSDKEIIGMSVDATEHSVMCIGGRGGERELIERLIDENPKGILSMVLDGFDFFKAIDEHLPSLKEKIMARDGKVVVRPDSGNPADILCGTAIPITEEQFTDTPLNEYIGKVVKYVCEADGEIHYWYITDPRKNDYWPDAKIVKPTLEQRGTFEILAEHFGKQKNEKGFYELNEKIGVIYGDSITPELADEILSRLKTMGFASTPVFGLGSYFYQHETRDTFGMAIKATAAIINGQKVNIQKDPATGDGTKKSLTGFIRVFEENGELVAKDNQETFEGGLLTPVFRDGTILEKPTYSEIYKRLRE